MNMVHSDSDLLYITGSPKSAFIKTVYMALTMEKGQN